MILRHLARCAHPPNKLCELERYCLVFAITFSVFLLEVVGGYWTNSLALLSDAFHALTDIAEILIAILTEYLVTRKSYRERTRAYSGALSAFLLGLTGLYISYEAIQRYFQPREILTLWMLIIATVGLIGNLIAIFILHQSAETHITQTSAVYHVVSDTLSSLVVIFSGIVTHFSGAVMFDPVASGIVSIFILNRTGKLFRTSLKSLNNPS